MTSSIFFSRPAVARGAALLMLASLLAAAPAAEAKPAVPQNKARVVVAVVDEPVNPYHELYHAGSSLYPDSAPSSVTPSVLKEFGIDKDHIIELTRTGDFATDFAADKDEFDAIRQGEPYWFEGTNVIGISFRPKGQRLRPDGDGSAHGVGTTSAVLTANPDAIVVSVDGINDDSEKWAFTHPAVDIVTTSYGPFTGVPTLNHLSFSYTGVVGNGKVHFGAATNDPTLAWFDQTSGPWWTIGVAGFQEGSTEGRQVMSGNLPDFVGDFTQELAYCRNCEEGTRAVSGTSFATPRSAGTFSKILLEARRAARHRGGIATKGVKEPLLVSGRFKLTNWEMRRALEEAAYYPATGDYGPGTGTFDLTSVPVIDVAPWAQAGWGAITPDPEHEVIKQALAHLGVGGKPTRSKDDQVCRFMTDNVRVRHLYWDQVAARGESFGTSEDPYIYC